MLPLYTDETNESFVTVLSSYLKVILKVLHSKLGLELEQMKAL